MYAATEQKGSSIPDAATYMTMNTINSTINTTYYCAIVRLTLPSTLAPPTVAVTVWKTTRAAQQPSKNKKIASCMYVPTPHKHVLHLATILYNSSHKL